MLLLNVAIAAAQQQQHISHRGLGLEAKCYHSNRDCRINADEKTPGVKHTTSVTRDTLVQVPNTTLSWFDQTLDHFNFKNNETFRWCLGVITILVP